jgi:hypothetical protein
MNMLKRNKLKSSKFIAILKLFCIFSISTMPLTQVYAGEVCCDPSTMYKVTIRTTAGSDYETKTFTCFKHGSVTPVETCYETLHYDNVIVQCRYCGYIWSNNKVFTGRTHSNPHH